MKKSLRILIICKSMPWRFKGGIQTHSWELARSLQQRGYAVTILSAGPFKAGEKQTEKDGVKLVELPYFPGRYLKPISLIAEEISFNWAVKKWVKIHHTQFDIIHAQGRSGYLLYGMKALRLKLVMTIHSIIHSEASHRGFFNLNARLHAIISARLESKMIAHTPTCLSVSEDLKQKVEQHQAHTNLTVVPNGVNVVEDEPLMLGVKPSRFLFVGRLHPVKGLMPLVKSIKNGSGDFMLDIIGNGPQYPALKAFVEKNRLQDRVRLLGEADTETIHRLIPYYVALVLPSYYETQGIVLLEANAHAVPVIASDIAAIRETVSHGENGLLCDPEKPEEYVAAMQRLIDNPLEAQLMGIRGRKKVINQYTWSGIAAATSQIYQKVAS